MSTARTTPEIRDHLKQHLDANDDLLVFELNGNWATYGLTDERNTWLRSNLGS
ncbi:MAG TPA: hypothetical protein VN811_11785 [Thermoanaerobaculia bacterium]|nr:hypothetical protein [Thermoanaerobaculia bacterium]